MHGINCSTFSCSAKLLVRVTVCGQDPLTANRCVRRGAAVGARPVAALPSAEAAGAVRAAAVLIRRDVELAQPEAARLIAEPCCPIRTCVFTKLSSKTHHALDTGQHTFTICMNT